MGALRVRRCVEIVAVVLQGLCVTLVARVTLCAAQEECLVVQHGLTHEHGRHKLWLDRETNLFLNAALSHTTTQFN
jgi:hypothetical protein